MPLLSFDVYANYQEVVRLRQEISSLENKLNSFGPGTSTSTIKSIEFQLQSARAQFKSLTEDAARAGASLELNFRKGANGAIGAVQTLRDKLASPIVGLGSALGVAGLGSFLNEVKNVRAQFQLMETNINTLLGSAEKGKDMMDKLTQFAATSPLDFQGTVRAAQMMLGFGIEESKILPYLQALGDVSMGDANRFNSLTLAFSQMSAAGKLMGQDLMQMVNAGFQPLDQLSKDTGKSIGELKEEMSAGKISAEMVQQAFINATSEGGKYYNMSQAASATIGGQMSMLGDATDLMLNDMGKSTEDFFIKVIQGATTLIENYDKVGGTLATAIGAFGIYKASIMASDFAEQKSAEQKAEAIVTGYTRQLEAMKSYEEAKRAEQTLSTASNLEIPEAPEAARKIANHQALSDTDMQELQLYTERLANLQAEKEHRDAVAKAIAEETARLRELNEENAGEQPNRITLDADLQTAVDTGGASLEEVEVLQQQRNLLVEKRDLALQYQNSAQQELISAIEAQGRADDNVKSIRNKVDAINEYIDKLQEEYDLLHEDDEMNAPLDEYGQIIESYEAMMKAEELEAAQKEALAQASELAAAMAEAESAANDVDTASQRLHEAATAANTAETNLQAAATLRSSTAEVANTTAVTSNTAAQGANTAATTTGAVATALQTAKNKVATVVQYGLNAAINQGTKAAQMLKAAWMANPLGIIITAVTTLIGLWMTWGEQIKDFINGTTELDKAMQKVNETAIQTQAEIAGEQKSIDLLFDSLRNAKEGTLEYENAKDAIIKQYGKYLDGLIDEKNNLLDVEAAYYRVAAAARDAANAKGFNDAVSNANTEYKETYTDKMTNIQDALNAKVGTGKGKITQQLGDTLYQLIKNEIDSTGMISDATKNAMYEAFGTKKNARSSSGYDRDATVSTILSSSKAIRDAGDVLEKTTESAKVKFSRNDNPFMDKTKDELDALEKQLDDMEGGEYGDLYSNGSQIQSINSQAELLLAKQNVQAALAKRSQEKAEAKPAEKHDKAYWNKRLKERKAEVEKYKKNDNSKEANEARRLYLEAQREVDSYIKASQLTSGSSREYELAKMAKEDEKKNKRNKREAEVKAQELAIEQTKPGVEKDKAKILLDNRKKRDALDDTVEKEAESLERNELQKWLKGGSDRKEYQYYAQFSAERLKELQDEYRKKAKENIAYDTQLAIINKKEDVDLKKINDQIIAAENSFLSQYGDLRERRIALEREYAKKIQEAKTDGERKSLQAELKKRTQDTDRAAFIQYLKEYGSFQQKKLALAEEYAQKIKEAENQASRNSIITERDAKLKEMDFNNNMKPIDSQLSVLDQLSSSALDSLLKELERLMQSSNLSAQQLKELSDRMNDVKDAAASRKSAWSSINPFDSSKWNPASQSADAAKRRLETARMAKQQAQQTFDTRSTNYNNEYTRFNNFLRSKNVNATEEQLQDSSFIDSIRGQFEGEDATEFNQMADSFGQAGTSLTEASEGLEAATAAEGAAEGAAGGAGGAAAFAVTDAIIHGVNENIQSADEFFNDKLGLADTEFGKGFSDFAASSASATAAFDSLKNGDIFGVVNNLTDALGSLGNVLGRMGISGMGSSDFSLHDDMEKLAETNEALMYAIQELAEELADSKVVEATGIYEQQIADLKNAMKDTQSIMARAGGAYNNGFIGIGGASSSNSKINDKMTVSEWARVSQVTGVAINNANQFWNLTSEQMHEVAEKAPTVYAKIKKYASEGFEDAGQYMDNYIEFYKQIEDLQDAYAEKLTATSFDNIRDEFRSTLLDMESDAQDFADSFESMMQNAVVNSLTDKYQERIQTWYENFRDSMKGDDATINVSEQERLREEWNRITDEAIEERDNLMKTMGWDATTTQRTSMKTLQGLSEDTGNAIEGRMTAIQNAVEAIRSGDSVRNISIAELNNELLQVMQEYSRFNVHYDNIEQQLAKICMEVQSINENTSKIVQPILTMQEDIAQIKRNTKNL